MRSATSFGLAAVVAASVFGFAACGGGEQDPGPSAAGSTDVPSAAASAPSIGAGEPHDEQTQAALDAREEQDLLARELPELVRFRRPDLGLLDLLKGKHLFERETFGGNGRTCLTCHSRDTGTVSPHDAQQRFAASPRDPLFAGDGSDDGQGQGVTRMLNDATVLVHIKLPDNVSLADDPGARSVVLRRGIPTTLNTPALDTVLMLDG
ncbi:MAG TPA: hypothetical protein VLJ62_22410, partial [Burkholderiaceae bacterium]|nr:hypothetical protein [Burkholderiaceae bacterium]